MTPRRARSFAAQLVTVACAGLVAAGCGEPRKSPAPRADASEVEPPPASASASPIPPAAVAESAAAKEPEVEILIVRPRLIDDLLVNPGIGLQTFQRFDGQPLNPPLTWSEQGPMDPPADARARRFSGVVDRLFSLVLVAARALSRRDPARRRRPGDRRGAGPRTDALFSCHAL